MSNKSQAQALTVQESGELSLLEIMPNPFNPLAEDEITNSLLEIRNDCSAAAQWKFGDDNFVGKEIKFCLLGWNKFYGLIGKGRAEDWMQLVFTPAPNESKLTQGLTYCTLIKTYSLRNFEPFIYEILSQKENPSLGFITATIETCSNDLGRFGQIKWKFEGMKEDQKPFFVKVAKFLVSNPSLIKIPCETMKLMPKDASPDEQMAVITFADEAIEKRKALIAATKG